MKVSLKKDRLKFAEAQVTNKSSDCFFFFPKKKYVKSLPHLNRTQSPFHLKSKAKKKKLRENDRKIKIARNNGFNKCKNVKMGNQIC